MSFRFQSAIALKSVIYKNDSVCVRACVRACMHACVCVIQDTSLLFIERVAGGH